MKILGYSCLSSCGLGHEVFWKSLFEGKVNLAPDRVFRIEDSGFQSSKERMTSQLIQVFSHIRQQAPIESQGLGIILSSTKGCTEDFVSSGAKNESDSIYPILESFLESTQLSPSKLACVSNACASSHGAFFLAELWLRTSQVKKVLVLAIDEVGPFILKGFQSLGALSKTSARPFAKNRDGLSLGEAAGGILLSLEGSSDFEIESVCIETEGFSITRPSNDGRSLGSIVDKVVGNNEMSAIIAHGTATPFNDRTEDKVFSSRFPNVPITAAKWCVGHTLGASGLMDTIAALGVLKFQRIFAMARTEEIDPDFKAFYIRGGSLAMEVDRVLVTSLGFGGMQAALVIGRAK